MNTLGESITLPEPGKVYRVVQWATGITGQSSLRAVIRHPYLELAGVWVHSAEKAGRDAGELCGLDAVGIKATNSLDEIIALKPDCVLYMPQGTDFDAICRMLAAGINVVSTRGDFNYPPFMDPALRQRVEDACRRGGATIHSTGSSPGFSTEALPLVLASMSRRVDCVTIDEFADIATSTSDDLALRIMGFGRPDDGIVFPQLLTHMINIYGNSMAVVADALGLPIDDVSASGETAPALSRVVTLQGSVIEKGTVAAQRIIVSGTRNGRPVIRIRLNWHCTTDIDVDWEPRENGWEVLVEGDAPLRVDIRYPRTAEAFADQMAGYTAHRAVNAVPFVCASEPGIRNCASLPNIMARVA